MPIYKSVRVFDPSQPPWEYRIGVELFNASMRHITDFLGHRGLKLSYDSCNAAVAVPHSPPRDEVVMHSHLSNQDHALSLLYGSSRLFLGLDSHYNAMMSPGPGQAYVPPNRDFARSDREEHAEQTAIKLARYLGTGFWQHGDHRHIYVDLAPCPECEEWLGTQDGLWYVHYFAEYETKEERNVQSLEKKRRRKDKRGRIQETGDDTFRPIKRANKAPG